MPGDIRQYRCPVCDGTAERDLWKQRGLTVVEPSDMHALHRHEAVGATDPIN